MSRQSEEDWSARTAVPVFGSTSNRQSLDRAVRLAIDAVGVECGSVTLMNGAGKLETVHATHADAVYADSLQYHLDEGPCLDAVRTASSLVVACLIEDDRWPRWRPWAAALGFANIVSAKLSVDHQQLGSLNLYGVAPDAYLPLRAGHAQMLAEMTSLLLEHLKVEQNLTRALQTRTQVGLAQGILMERFDISRDRAFAVLRTYSQTHTVKLRDVSTQLVDTRHETGSPEYQAFSLGD